MDSAVRMGSQLTPCQDRTLDSEAKQVKVQVFLDRTLDVSLSLLWKRVTLEG